MLGERFCRREAWLLPELGGGGAAGGSPGGAGGPGVVPCIGCLRPEPGVAAPCSEGGSKRVRRNTRNQPAGKQAFLIAGFKQRLSLWPNMSL